MKGSTNVASFLTLVLSKAPMRKIRPSTNPLEHLSDNAPQDTF